MESYTNKYWGIYDNRNRCFYCEIQQEIEIKE
ncbi:MAG: hypothetical protein ACJA2M_001992 [Polaribacter sp.]|jgi:hypothetical protein